MKLICNHKMDNKENRGATSVLVVFMMIVLVTFGAFSISAANVNLKLSKKAINWSKTFYELDGEGELLVADLDYVLAGAEAFAVDYIRLEAYTFESYPLISNSLQIELNELYTSGEVDNNFLNTVLNKLYFYSAEQNLEEFKTRRDLLSSYNQSVEFEKISGEESDEIYVFSSLTSADNSDYHLDIEMTLNPVKYMFTMLNDDIQGSRYPSSSRFYISEWRQWQDQTDPNGGPKLWDGIVK